LFVTKLKDELFAMIGINCWVYDSDELKKVMIEHKIIW